MDRTRNTALVISGGGSKGAFAVGVVKSLFERYRRDGWFSIIGGSSTGALIAPVVGLMGAREPGASAALKTLLYEYTHVRTQNVLERKHLIDFVRSSDCLNRTAPLRRRVQEVFRPECFEWLRRSESPYCYVVYTNYQSGARVVASPREPGMTWQRFIDAMIASASVPVLMEPAVIDGERCFDGGVRDLLPFGRAIDLGAELIVPIFLDAVPFRRSEDRFRRLDRILYRTLEIMLDETGRNDFEMARLVNLGIRARERIMEACSGNPALCRAVERVFADPKYRDLFGQDKRLVEIVEGLRPLGALTEDPLRFDPAQMRRWVELGETRAREVVTRSPFASRSRAHRPAALAASAALPL